MPRLRYRVPHEGERVEVLSGDAQGRKGTVCSYDFDRSLVFVHLDDDYLMTPPLAIGPADLRVIALNQEDGRS